jgi:hypothetical protein
MPDKTLPKKSAALARMYTAYTVQVQALSLEEGFPKLDACESRMLEALGAAWFTSDQIYMRDATKLVSEISNASAQRYLHSLAAKGMLELVVDERNRRNKIVLATPASHCYFYQLWQCIQKASKGLRPITS